MSAPSVQYHREMPALILSLGTTFSDAKNGSGRYISEGKLDEWLVNHKNIGAMTSVIVASILIRT
jgi:hypothetical protein